MVVIHYIYTPSLIEYDSFMVSNENDNHDLNDIEVDLCIKSIDLDSLRGKKILINMRTNQIEYKEHNEEEKQIFEKKKVTLVSIKHVNEKKQVRVYKEKNELLVCALDVFYPVMRFSGNTSREVIYRLPESDYKLVSITKKKTYFITYEGLKKIFDYRINKKQKNGSVDKVKCAELLAQLQSYM